jgi:hypothetical protein
LHTVGVSSERRRSNRTALAAMQLEAPLAVIGRNCGCSGSLPQLPHRAPCDDDDDDDDVLVTETPPLYQRRLRDDGDFCATGDKLNPVEEAPAPPCLSGRSLQNIPSALAYYKHTNKQTGQSLSYLHLAGDQLVSSDKRY